MAVKKSTSVRVASVRAERDYTLWLCFDDGLAGKVYCGNLLKIGAFQLWRDVRVFVTARVDAESGCIVWPAGVRLDPDILRADIAASHQVSALTRGLDPAWQRFRARMHAKPSKRGGNT